MMIFLSKLFNIRANEWSRVLLIYLILFLIVTSSSWGKIIVEAAFLERVGVEFLPWVFVVNAFFSIIAIAIYTAFADRVKNDRLLLWILGASIILIAGGVLALVWGWELIAYPILYVMYFVVLVDTFNLHWGTYINGFYDTQSAKRIIPVISTSGRIAGIVAGLTMPLLNFILSPIQIIILWLVVLFGAIVVIWFMPRILQERKQRTSTHLHLLPSQKKEPSTKANAYLDNIQEGYRYVIQSPFLRWLAVSTLISIILITLIYYRANELLLAEFQTTERISSFVGVLTGVSNLIMLPILLSLSRIIGRIGLGNANFIFPGATFITAFGLIFLTSFPVSMASLGYVDRTAFHRTFFAPINTLLYNAVPPRLKGRARAFIVGFLTPVGSLIGGVILLLLPFVSTPWLLSVLIGILAIAFLACAFVIRQHYAQALITMLEQEDFSFLLSQEASDLTVSDPATLRSLQEKLEQSENYEFTIFMAKLISQMGGKKAVSILGKSARTAENSRSRVAIIDVLVAADTSGDEVRKLYESFLDDEDGEVRLAALRGLERAMGINNPDYLQIALTKLQDPEDEIRAHILGVLLQSKDPTHQLSANEALNIFLTSDNPGFRLRGIRVLNQTEDVQFIEKLVQHLNDPADEVRLETTLAIEKLSHQKLPPVTISLILDTIEPLLNDPIERVRQATLSILANIGNHETYNTLIQGLSDNSAQVRTSTVDVLVSLGKKVIPSIHPLLDSPEAGLRKMGAVILSRINKREFGPLIDIHVTGNLLAIYRNYGQLDALSPYISQPSVSTLKSALSEKNERLREEIFYLLTAINDPQALSTIIDSFHSDNKNLRANAAEALEALVSPQTVQLIAPLFEPDTDSNQLLHLSQDAWDMKYPSTAEAISQLISDPDDAWLRAMTTFALGEIGVIILQDSLKNGSTASDQQNGTPTRKKRRGRSTIDLLSQLDEEDQPTVKSPREEKKHWTRRSPRKNIQMALGRSDDDTPTADTSKEAATTSENSIFTPNASNHPFTFPDIETMLEDSLADPVEDVRLAARAASRMLIVSINHADSIQEGALLSTIEKIIFLKEVPFFQGMTVDQLRVLATVCEEELFDEDTRIFHEGDPGGALYVVVSGSVGIEQEKRKGSFARLATIESHSYFGEMDLFDNSPRSASAITLQDTLILRIRREPLIALARQYPDLSLELINILSDRLRAANDRIADLTRTRTRKLQKFYDQFD
ncbi:MAG: cyclic nucleotide-binding domain-containing protein [Chloroflexota bacterium]